MLYFKRTDMNIKRELGEKIKRLRKKRGYTQEQFAEMIDISSRNVSNIEQGISFPKPETLEKIVQSFNITTDELFAVDHIKSKEELLENINQYLVKIKHNDEKLEVVYKILRDLIET